MSVNKWNGMVKITVAEKNIGNNGCMNVSDYLFGGWGCEREHGVGWGRGMVGSIKELLDKILFKGRSG